MQELLVSAPGAFWNVMSGSCPAHLRPYEGAWVHVVSESSQHRILSFYFFHHLLFVQWQAARWCKGGGTKKAWSCDAISDSTVFWPRIFCTCKSLLQSIQRFRCVVFMTIIELRVADFKGYVLMFCV